MILTSAIGSTSPTTSQPSVLIIPVIRYRMQQSTILGLARFLGLTSLETAFLGFLGSGGHLQTDRGPFFSILPLDFQGAVAGQIQEIYQPPMNCSALLLAPMEPTTTPKPRVVSPAQYLTAQSAKILPTAWTASRNMYLVPQPAIFLAEQYLLHLWSLHRILPRVHRLHRVHQLHPFLLS